MNTYFEQIVDVSQIGKMAPVNINKIIELAGNERFAPAFNDAPQRLILAIDVQNDFIEGGSLEVPGSVGDVERMARFIFKNIGGISKIMCSLDTHDTQQIFHPCWWANPAGDHPAPYTPITYDDILNNRWRPVIGKPNYSVEYVKELEQRGGVLVIWPYHCLKGGPGATLENEFFKMVQFYSIVRKSKISMIQKGTDAYSEMYGIIKPEYSRNNFINTPVLTAFEEYDEIYVFGEAASHCLLRSVEQIGDHFSNRPDITQRITVLEDCCSPIKGYEDATKAAFARLKNTYGINFKKSTDINF